MTKKKASSTLYFVFFFIIFLAFCAFAVDGAIVLTNRAKLQNITEAAALAAAEEFNSDSDPKTVSMAEQAAVDSVAQGTFGLLQQDSLETAKIVGVNIQPGSMSVTVTTNMISQPFFLAFLGVTGINLDAKAIAKSEPVSIWGTSGPGVHWATKKATYSADAIVNDSVILQSLNTNVNSSIVSGKADWGLINSDDGKPLSLGPSGFITIKLPVPILDKPGDDLEIDEIGKALEGYMVFAGLDVNPEKPYLDYTDTGDDIKWVNITCTGRSTVASGPSPANGAASTNMGAQDKFYGSGYFDIGKNCSGYNTPVSMIKYIRIIDDNSESAYVNSNGAYHQTMLYGEASTTTPGADIDAVKVLNYVHLTQ